MIQYLIYFPPLLKVTQKEMKMGFGYTTWPSEYVYSHVP